MVVGSARTLIGHTRQKFWIEAWSDWSLGERGATDCINLFHVVLIRGVSSERRCHLSCKLYPDPES